MFKTVSDQLLKYRIDVAAVQEVRWTGSGQQENGEHVLYYSGHDTKHIRGTGFVVSSRVRVIDFVPFNERLCRLRIRGRIFNISIICVYAPTEDKDAETKERFYDDLETLFHSTPKADVKIVLGDFNAKIGREACFFPTIGKHSLHEVSNDNGTRAVNFAASKDLVVGSTWFPHKTIHKATWLSPDGATKNQIDHLLIEGRHFSAVQDVRTFRGADCDSDHMLVVGTYRARISNVKKERAKRTEKWNTEKLLDQDTKLRYQEVIAEKLAQRGEEDNQIESMWAHIKADVLEATSEVLGVCPKHRKKQWFDEECQEAVDKRCDAREKQLQRTSRSSTAEYSRVRRETRRLLRKKKRDFQNQKLLTLEEHYRRNEVRKFFAAVNAEKKGYRPKLGACRDSQGTLLCDKEEIIDRWAEYFESILNIAVHEDQATPTGPNQAQQSDEDPPSFEETCKAMMSLKNNKAPGCDNICAEMLKEGGEALQRRIHKLIVRIWSEEEIPEDWKVGIICPLYKKGDRLNCANYRGITLLSAVYKILSAVILNRLKPIAENVLGDYQCGFRPGRSTTDQIFNIRQIMEKMYEFGIDIHQLFVDFRQAYDSIDRRALWTAMGELGVPSKYIRLSRMTLEGSKSCVRVQNDLSKTFDIGSGVRQGDGLSATLFNFALEIVIRRAHLNNTGTILHKSSQVLAYADDIDLIGRRKATVEEAFQSLEEASNTVGLQSNIDKTKYMRMSRNPPSNGGSGIAVGENTIECVRSFQYLGVNINASNDMHEEIESRIMCGCRGLYALQSVLRSTQLGRSMKVRVYKAILRPAVLYGCETWTLTQADELRLGIFERKVLRTIFGPVRVAGEEWRRRYNHELKALYREPDIVAVAKASRLRWAGHVQRMDVNSTTSLLVRKGMYATRPRGNRRTTWLENIEADLGKLGVTNWTDLAKDRKKWRSIVMDAQTRLGL